jgi:ferredoxin-nitrite reductase
VDGYNIVLGGGVDDTQAIAREIWTGIVFESIPELIEQLLCTYLAQREDNESFATFTQRMSVDELRGMVAEKAAA